MDQLIDSSDNESKKITKFPNFLKLLFFVEMWERFSYYGMRGLLVIFLTSQLGFKDEKAYAIYSVFAAIGYAGPVLAGFLADKLVGFRNMVLIGGIIITLGHAVMSLIELKSDLIYIGLAFIAVGTGMFKGNISNLLGSCYNANDPERNRGFTLFYVSVNLGSFIATVSCGYIAHLYGWNYGFGLAGVGMLIGLITFVNFEYILQNNIITNSGFIVRAKLLGMRTPNILFIGGIILSLAVSGVIMYSEFFASSLALVGLIVLGIFIYIIYKSTADQRKNLVVLLIMIIFFMCFFALEMQFGSLINLFTKRNVVDNILGITIPATISQAINPLSIMVFGSVIGRYMKFSPKYNTMIFASGLLSMAISFFILYIGCLNADSNGKVGYLYMFIAISVIGIGELCIGPLIQAQATLLAPRGLKGLIMGMVMLSLAFSNLAGIIISKFMSVPSIKGEVNCLESLSIYTTGFLNIALFNLGLTAIFLILYKFINGVIAK